MIRGPVSSEGNLGIYLGPVAVLKQHGGALHYARQVFIIYLNTPRL